MSSEQGSCTGFQVCSTPLAMDLGSQDIREGAVEKDPLRSGTIPGSAPKLSPAEDFSWFPWEHTGRLAV